MYFYDKHVYFFHNEHADSSESQWEHKLISWNIRAQLFKKISEYCVLNPLKQLRKWPLTSSLS